MQFHANRASIRSTFKAPSTPTSSASNLQPISSRSSSTDLASTNLEKVPNANTSFRHEQPYISNSSLNFSSVQPDTHSPFQKPLDKRVASKSDYSSLSFDYKLNDWSQETEVPPLNSFGIIEQESLLISDLLYVLVVSFFLFV